MRARGNTLSVLLVFHTLRLTQAVGTHVPGGYGVSGTGKNTPMDSARSPPPASTSLPDAIGVQNGSLSLPTKSHFRGISARDNDPCYVEPYSGPGVIDVTFPPFDPAAANVYRYRQQQSVNLGSWYVGVSGMVLCLETLSVLAGSFKRVGWFHLFLLVRLAKGSQNWMLLLDGARLLLLVLCLKTTGTHSSLEKTFNTSPESESTPSACLLDTGAWDQTTARIHHLPQWRTSMKALGAELFALSKWLETRGWAFL
jgi:hypothetical protein